MAKSLYEGCGSLRAFPYSGRKGRIDGTRELVFPGLPYIVVYRIEDQVVDVLRIYHGALDWRIPTLRKTAKGAGPVQNAQRRVER